MVMAMLQQIAQTKSCHQAYQQDTRITILTQDDVIDPHLRITTAIAIITVTIETGIGLVGPDPIHAARDTAVTVTLTHEEVTLGPRTDPMPQYIMSQKLKHIPLQMRHPTQQILITQKSFQRLQ